MSGSATPELLCECNECSQKRNLISWLDNKSIPCELTNDGSLITNETRIKCYQRELLLDLVRVLAKQQAREDHDKD